MKTDYWRLAAGDWRKGAVVVALMFCATFIGVHDAQAQLDPLLFLKRTKPNVILVVETANRMQRDATSTGDYIDANVYSRNGQGYEVPLGVSDANTKTVANGGKYRRLYKNLQYVSNGSGDKFSADSIEITGDLQTGYSTFDERTRLSVARRAMIAAVAANQSVARFGLIKMRQNTPQAGLEGNSGPAAVSALTQQLPTDRSPFSGGKWSITRPTVIANNGSVAAMDPLVKVDAANANTTILTTLSHGIRDASGCASSASVPNCSLMPAGSDDANTSDIPLDNMLDDAKTEAARIIGLDTECRNTVVVLIAGGGEGSTTNEDPAAKALQFLNIGANHRVPVYVIAIAPAASAVAQLQAIAANSGGQYTEITSAMVSATALPEAVPQFVTAINTAVQHAFASQADFDVDPTATLPFGPSTESQVTSPIIGTVDLENGTDITGAALPNSVIYKPNTVPAEKIPQRSNLLVTSAFRLPGFDGRLRAFRTYKPVADATKTIGYKFVNDGTRLWIACAPGAVPTAASANDAALVSPCSAMATATRNIYTALPDGSVIKFDTTQAAALAPYLNVSGSVATATTVISFIRSQPMGAVVDSTPAIMDAPSLDPPPDSDYPGFAAANAGRRSLVWVGANDGMLHAIDARTGVEAWAFIPFNLLPKLKQLRQGQSIGSFNFFVDGSPKIADVKINGNWRTYLIMGEGPGGTFYQTFDVTLDNMASSVASTAAIGTVLSYFSDPSRIALKWEFPKYSSFDVSITSNGLSGDIAAGASAIEKTVGETWSDPAIGQIESTSGPFAVLTGSGFLKYSTQQLANRGGTIAGTTFYILDAATGSVLASKNVGNDNKGETVDNCATAGDCTQIKNALQADPVATGPADSRFITKTYMGDLDGRIWRFDISLDNSHQPTMPNNAVKVYDMGEKQPNFASMATVNIGGSQQYIFQGTGSDLLPSNGVNYSYSLFVILDKGGSGEKKAQIDLTKTDGAGDDEKVTAFPAVAGDIVFFSTTSFKPATPCVLPDANLYAFTFIGGPAYDTNNSGNLTNADSTKVRTSTGGRASAPFIVDQHIAFAAGGKIEVFGDNEDFNNGVGQAGVRILSWREVR